MEFVFREVVLLLQARMNVISLYNAVNESDTSFYMLLLLLLSSSLLLLLVKNAFYFMNMNLVTMCRLFGLCLFVC